METQVQGLGQTLQMTVVEATPEHIVMTMPVTGPSSCSSSSLQRSTASGSPSPVSTSVQPSTPRSRYEWTCPGRVGNGVVTRRMPLASSSTPGLYGSMIVAAII